MKCLQYCYFTRHNCRNAGKVEEGTDAAIISRSKSRKDSINIPSSLCPQLSKVIKQHQVNTTSLQK